MNTMMASGGYPWTVIPVTDRKAYVSALEKASVGEDIAPFVGFLAGLVKKRLAGEPCRRCRKLRPETNSKTILDLQESTRLFCRIQSAVEAPIFKNR
jgi:hypothetical protein